MKTSLLAGICCFLAASVSIGTADGGFDGLNLDLGNLARVSDAQTRSISPENLTGEKGKGGMALHGTGEHAARELGQGWKISPSIRIAAHATYTLADIDGPGCIQ